MYTHMFLGILQSPVTIWWLFLNLSALSPGSQVLSNQYTETDENIEMIWKKGTWNMKFCWDSGKK